MAICIIHLLEMIDVKHQHSKRHAAPHRPGVFLAQSDHAKSAIQNTRQWIKRREFLQLLMLQRVMQRNGEGSV